MASKLKKKVSRGNKSIKPGHYGLPVWPPQKQPEPGGWAVGTIKRIYLDPRYGCILELDNVDSIKSNLPSDHPHTFVVQHNQAMVARGFQPVFSELFSMVTLCAEHQWFIMVRTANGYGTWENNKIVTKYAIVDYLQIWRP